MQPASTNVPPPTTLEKPPSPQKQLPTPGKTSSYFTTSPPPKPSPTNVSPTTPEKPPSPPQKQSTSSPSGFSILMNRPEHPPNKGKKALPIGQPGCLEGLSFLITGILDSLEREEASKLIEDYGGYVNKM